MKNLNTLRRMAGYTQYSLAKTARVSAARIANVETQRGSFTREERKRIVAVLLDAIQRNGAALRIELQNELAADAAEERLAT